MVIGHCMGIPIGGLKVRISPLVDNFILDIERIVKHNFSMNKLPLQTRVQILSMLCEGSSMRSVSRVADVSINTVTKLLVDAGKACADFHDEKFEA